MSAPINFLQVVQTYNLAGLEYMSNAGAFIFNSNKTFKDFNNTVINNIGPTVNIALPTRMTSYDGLVANFQSSTQRYQPLVIDSAKNSSYAFTNQEFILNVKDWFKEFGKGAVANLATKVERDVASLCETAPYRFYGDGRTQITSPTQLATMLSQYKTYAGMAIGELEVYLFNGAVPQILNGQFNQFVMDRNEESYQSWMVMDWENAKFFQSNLLPIHRAGTVGNQAQTLTVVSTNDPTGNNITSITYSGASASDIDAIKKYDSLQCITPGFNYLTFVGQEDTTNAPVQMSATADAASDGAGNVTVTFNPPLCATLGSAVQNIPSNIVAGMQFEVLPDHRCGMVVGSKALYLAMPRLPEERPYDSSSITDPDTGVSMRLTYGSVFGQNEMGFIHSVLWGKMAVPDYCMKIAFPV